ncbi:MAG: hypothetical protein WB952_13045 [Terriglobales bacterium]
MGLSVSTEWSYRGLRTVVLENRVLRVVILPEVGAKIWQIIYKPLDALLLWNNPRVAPAKLPLNSRYDDVWSGGWDELFPNDEVATIHGEMYPDHGELWTGEWTAEPFRSGDEAGVRMCFTTPISAISVEKTIKIRRGSSHIYFHHVFQNLAQTPFPFLWKLHPAMTVTPQHRIDFPRMKVITEPAFPGTLGGGPASLDWPGAEIAGREVDLRRVPAESEKQLYFFYGTEMAAGWCALTNTANRLACGLVFDQKVFPSCWLFATYGGWRNYNVAVLEPCTGYPLNFEAMRAAGRQRTLAPGEKLSTDVLLTLQEETTEVSRIEPDGTIVAR